MIADAFSFNSLFMIDNSLVVDRAASVGELIDICYVYLVAQNTGIGMWMIDAPTLAHLYILFTDETSHVTNGAAE